MVERPQTPDGMADEREQARERAERLRWISSHMREASEADLIEEATIVEDDDGPPLGVQ